MKNGGETETILELISLKGLHSIGWDERRLCMFVVAAGSLIGLCKAKIKEIKLNILPGYGELVFVTVIRSSPLIFPLIFC